MSLRCVAFFLFVAAPLAAQIPSNASLNGKYWFRHLQVATGNSADLADIRSALGTLVFSGSGQFTFAAQQTIGAAGPVTLSGSGTYNVDSSGVVILTNPQKTGAVLNARLGTEAVAGSSTETADNTFDLFVAVPAPAGGASSALLSGRYFGIQLEFPGGSAAGLRNSFFAFQADGAGGITPFTASGHSQLVNAGAPATQNLSALNYGVSADGAGTLNLPLSGPLLSGVQNLLVSANGNIVLGNAAGAGGHAFLLAVKAVAGVSSNAWTGEFWSAGLRFAPGSDAEAYAGSLNAVPELGKVVVTHRVHQVNVAPFVFTGVNSASLNPDGTGTQDVNTVGLGAAGNLYVALENNALDPAAYDVSFGVRMPAVSGPGLFLSPLAILNGASFAPPGNPVSPGEFVTLFVAGLPSQSVQATPPYPKTLGDVTVTVNGVESPLSFVNASQVNVLVPYATTGNTATFVVTAGGRTSNTATIPLAPTAPGVFAKDGSGTGLGAVTHTNFTLVTPSAPAQRGETILIFLTGLGAVTNPPADGAAGGSNPFSMTTVVPRVVIAAQTAVPSYAGLAPGFPGLYQLNVTVPSKVPVTGNTVPLAIQTRDAFHCQIDLPVQ